ncbi:MULTISPECIES: flavodoxin family protein [unclassified Crossiella]|uniref:flavodoxin family protein n=1 Tax=unclassified Crossiella TaxID=2620835 RepID=UPI001FFFB95C|nr:MULTISPECIES: flavodoxin family protein [unclassified Crossiella]MCK2244535.1 flavodoxin family protein [Crossiella sp. S99.2]MCK2258166.1 flavodoxin family protein [Crossiella sp. S99.1]
MQAIIVCTSVSHGNTRRVAEAMGQVLDARVVAPDQVDPATLADYDLVGFGSGIFLGSFHAQLREFVQALPVQRRRHAFVFATSGFPEAGFQRFSRPLAKVLRDKGFAVADTFSCRGFDTWLPFKLVGGVRKGRPDAADLVAAREFADGLRTRLDVTP